MLMTIRMKRETIRLTTGYTRMATVLVFHQYYRNLICRDLDIRPAPPTAAMMQDYGILLKRHPNGFSLASDRSRDYNHQVFDGMLPLEFYFRVTNPLFVNFTDIPYTSDLHFDFRITDNPDHPYLHEQDYVTSANYSVDGVEGISGRILLELNRQNDWFGVGSSDQSQKTESNYLITFRSRMTFWHYIFSQKHGSNQTLTIHPPERQQTSSSSLSLFTPRFDHPETTETRQGRSVTVLRATTQLPFMDRWDDWFEVEVTGENGHKRTKPLPFGRPENLHFDETQKIFTTSIFESL